MQSVLITTNKTDCHDITEILLKVALNTITLTLNFKENRKCSLLDYKDYGKVLLNLW